NDETQQNTDNVDRQTDITADNSDERLLDEEAHAAEQEVSAKVKTVINLDTQSDCPYFAPIIRYLVDGELPQDSQQARKVILQAEHFYIEGNQLWHLALLRGKRLDKLSPRWPLLCIPR